VRLEAEAIRGSDSVDPLQAGPPNHAGLGGREAVHKFGQSVPFSVKTQKPCGRRTVRLGGEWVGHWRRFDMVTVVGRTFPIAC